jgi:hypothetical protein
LTQNSQSENTVAEALKGLSIAGSGSRQGFRGFRGRHSTLEMLDAFRYEISRQVQPTKAQS